MPNSLKNTTRTLALSFLLALVAMPATAFIDGADRTLTRLGDFGEWTLANSSFSGNPYDLQGSATFVHSNSGEVRTTPMFFAGGNTWKFRFTATQLGNWTFTTASNDGDLNGFTGTVAVTSNSSNKGFVQASGSNWVRSASGEAFVPQYVMYAGPHYYRTNRGLIANDINRFLDNGHGFTGFHVPVYCRWFDIDQPRCSEVGDSNPDPASFDALEAIIQQVYNAGGTVHLWAWGDTGRQQNPTQLRNEGGINGPADLRLQRYIAARLGPMPGWTMGYGYDLFEFVGGGELTFWRNNMQNLMGWTHLLGARGSTNSFAQPSEAMDYASYETHRPSFPTYRLSAAQRPGKPAFSEDRFRFRGTSARAKDYTFDEMRRGMWHSAIAGGVANIWGNLTTDGSTYDEDINEAILPSNSFPNRDALRTYRTFMDRYFEGGMLNCDGESDAACQRRANGSARNLYRQDTNTISVDLSAHTGSRRVTAVDTVRAFAPVALGEVGTGNVQIDLPYVSDWAVSIGGDSGAPAPRPIPQPEPVPAPVPTPQPEPVPTPVPTAPSPVAPTPVPEPIPQEPAPVAPTPVTPAPVPPAVPTPAPTPAPTPVVPVPPTPVAPVAPTPVAPVAPTPIPPPPAPPIPVPDVDPRTGLDSVAPDTVGSLRVD